MIASDSVTSSTSNTPLERASDVLSSRGVLWTGRVLSALAVLFLSFDVAIKLLQHPIAVAGTVELGYPADSILVMGIAGLICLVLYVIPRTAILGAVLWTGYLGGAIATHLRLGNPLFSHVLFPIYIALFIWGGLWLRDAALRQLFPFHTRVSAATKRA